MRKITMSALLALGLGTCVPVDAKQEHILPVPQQLKLSEGKLTIAAGSAVKVVGVESSPALKKFFNEFGVTNVTFDKSGTGGNVVVKMVASIPGAHDHALEGYKNEAYTLKVTDSSIEIAAVSEVGVIRAAQTLTQLAEGYEPASGINLEQVEITDWPAFKLRGYMHDIGRSYISVEMLKRHIDLLSRFKVNTFHWHLTENQAFRFEVKNSTAAGLTDIAKLNEARTMTRDAGKYYKQEECKEIYEYAKERGIVVIPEIDIPGHSAAFDRAFGFNMQDSRALPILKEILKQVSDIFVDAPYLHIGADEVATNVAFLNSILDHIHSLGKKCVVWNPVNGIELGNLHADMFQMWGTRGKALNGKPNIDCRYNYTNHFDVFADLVGIYKSNIYYKQRGDETVAGTISGMWNDRRVENEHQIVAQNNFYANVIASASRAWQGGGERYIDNCNNGGTNGGGGVMLPNSGKEYEDFKNWETRFLFHKAHALSKVAADIPYVKQTNIRWRITDAFDNGGDGNKVFPPEQQMNSAQVLPDSYTYEGNTYGTGIATGAGIYLSHTWGNGVVRGFYNNPQFNQTAYAWTYVYSPEDQKVGAQIEFQNYSRSEQDGVPANGWDFYGSKIWLNGQEIPAPNYRNKGKNPGSKEDLLLDENFAGRKPIEVQLKKGWNKVFLKLPYLNKGCRLKKWMFTCVFTDMEGKAAVDGLIYSPNQCKDEAAEQVAAKVSEVKAYRNSQVKEQPGYYEASVAAALDAEIAKIEKTYAQDMTAAQREQQVKDLEAALAAFKSACKSAKQVMPKASANGSEYFYTLSTPLRENRYATSKGADADMVGEKNVTRNAYWKFVSRTDGDYDIVNSDGTYVSPESANNSALKTKAAAPAKGWKLGAADETGYFIITSGTAQFNQTNNGQLGYKVYNWGSGNNTSDTGCKYAVKAVNAGDLEVNPTLPEVGKNYYFYNQHKKGTQYFYDDGGAGFSMQNMEKKNYVWTCEDAGNGNFYFKNLSTGNYFAWKAISSTAYAWTLETTKGEIGKNGVINDGCVNMKNTGNKKYLVCKVNGFDEATRAGYYDDTFSSDFKFVLCTKTAWEEDKPVNYYSKSYGENWVRLLWNKAPNDAAGVVSTTVEATAAAVKSEALDMTGNDQLWALVGDEKGFVLQNAAFGDKWALNVSSTANGTEAKFVDKEKACKWVLVKKGGSFAIAPASNKGQSLNSFGGARGPLKLWSADDDGSKWKLQANIVPALEMATEIEGENPYGDVVSVAGYLRFLIDGQASSTAVYTDGNGVNTYYLPDGAKVVLTQDRGSRGFANGGLQVDGKDTEKVEFTVGEKVGAVKSLFIADLSNGIILYKTPDANGKPYRIPAIATAKNGDIFAISDNRPCGMDIGYGEVDIKYRISKDNGKTWGKEFFVADGLGNNNGGKVWKTGFGDAAFVADAERNELLVMMVCGKTVCWDGNYIPNSSQSNPNRVAQVRAKLNEATGEWEWTQPEEVTESIYPLFVENGNATVKSLFIGSGRICQSRVTKVGDYYRLYCAMWTKNEGNRVIYSDDFGKTWHVLGKVSDRPGRGGDEPKCEELPDGSVVLSSRRNGRLFNIYRYTDVKKGTGRWLGEQYSENQHNGIKVGNSTNGEIMMLPAVRKSDGQKVVVALQSVPFGNNRSNVGIYFKEITPAVYSNVQKLAADWTKGLQVSYDESAYSTMTLQKDYKIGFFFEEAPGSYCMVYIPLTMEKITNGEYALDEDSCQTGIEDLEVEKNEPQVIYDLSGRRVQHPSKGVFIVNGKKMMVK